MPEAVIKRDHGGSNPLLDIRMRIEATSYSPGDNPQNADIV
ncbi:hypothetical protein [Mesorhizobium sp. NZP2234]|nr:hypothetical protein [Mesorhizobium sp. NZP2234]